MTGQAQHRLSLIWLESACQLALQHMQEKAPNLEMESYDRATAAKVLLRMGELPEPVLYCLDCALEAAVQEFDAVVPQSPCLVKGGTA